MVSDIFVTIYAICAFVVILILYVSIYKSSKEKYIFFSTLLLHLFLYNIGYILEVKAETMTQVRVAIVIQYAGFSFIAPSLILFIQEYIKKPIKNKLVVFFMFLIPIVGFFMVFIDSTIHIFYKEIRLITDTEVNYILVKGSIYYKVFHTYMYSMYIVSFFLSINEYKKGNEIIKKKLRFLPIAIFVSLVFAGFYLAGFKIYNMDTNPIIITIVCVYITYSMYVSNLFLSTPYIRSNVLEEIEDGYVLFNSDNKFLDANKVALKIFPNLKLAKKGTDLFNYIDILKVRDLKSKKVDNIEFTVEDEKGEKRDYRITASVVTRKRAAKINCWLIYDITEYKQMMAELEHMARYDTLTGVYNRSFFYSRVNELFYENKGKGTPFAIIMMDIDNFKYINDTYGHICGDKTIADTANRLSKSVRRRDILARYGGEEFILYIDNITDNVIFNIGEKLRQSISNEKFTFDGKEFTVTLSLGITMFDETKNKNLSELLVSSVEALYNAKKTTPR